MLRLLGIALAVLFCSLLVREHNRVFAVLLSVSGTVLLIFSLLSQLSQTVDELEKMVRASALSMSFMKIMLKALGITLMTQMVSDLCRDNGENALATATETVAKLAIVGLLLPLFESVISVVGGLLS